MDFAHPRKLLCLMELSEKSFRAVGFAGQTCILVFRHRCGEFKFLSVLMYRMSSGKLQIKFVELEIKDYDS